MRSPRSFFEPLAIGAPDPLREIPVRPSRMIHFLDFSNEKMVAKAADVATKTDILLGNLEDAVPVDRKEAAREGLIRVGRDIDLGETALWTRVNALESPWVLDDLTRVVGEIGDRIEVVMVPKVEGPWDIHYVDRLLAQLEAKVKLDRPLLVHAILETSLGVVNLEEIAKKVFSPPAEEVRFAKKVLEAIPDGRGVHMIDGKMQDDATWKQCKVMVDLARQLAAKDPELAEAYGFAPAHA